MPHREQRDGATDEWYTPPHVFTALGCEYDEDVASPGAAVTPWIPAKRFLCADSLTTEWRGFIWMNPPFGGRGNKATWLEKFFRHGNGIALVPDRTSASWWQRFAPKADAVLFVSPKLKFIAADGAVQGTPARGTALFAAGLRGEEALFRAQKAGLGRVFVPSVSSL